MKILLFILVFLTALVSCKPICSPPYIEYKASNCCLDVNNNKICDSDEKKQSAPVQTPLGKAVNQVLPEINDTEFPARTFALIKFEKFLNNLSKVDYDFQTEESNSTRGLELQNRRESLVRSDNSNKAFVLHVLSQPRLSNATEFASFVSSPVWDAWHYYINDTMFHWTYRPLLESELASLLPGYSFDKYVGKDSTWIDYDVYENPIYTSLGTVFEYRLETTIYDQYGYMQGNWQDPVLLYKVPCTNDMVVYLRPKVGIDFGSLVQLNQKKAVVEENFAREIAGRRQQMISEAEAVMRFCGIKKSMFSGYQFESFEQHEHLVENDRVFYKLLYNYSLNIGLLLKDAGPKDMYKIQSLNITFAQLDKNKGLGFTHISAKVFFQSLGSYVEYRDIQIFGGTLQTGVPVSRYDSQSSKVMFDVNSTIVVRPYMGFADSYEADRIYLGEGLNKQVSDFLRR